MEIIHIQWEGPHTIKEKDRLNGPSDYGVYQVYGCHPVYGVDTLLYIGKACEQTFATRLNQEGQWITHQDSQRLSFYVGRLGDWSGTPTDEEWSGRISRAEKLLILAHRPAWNAQKEIRREDLRLRDIHVLNWDCYRSLLPEVSGARYATPYGPIGYNRFSYAGPTEDQADKALEPTPGSVTPRATEGASK
jgi:hypothetical protein